MNGSCDFCVEEDKNASVPISNTMTELKQKAPFFLNVFVYFFLFFFVCGTTFAAGVFVLSSRRFEMEQ